MNPRQFWKILVAAGFFLLAGGLIFWTAFAFIAAEKPQRRLIKIGLLSLLAAYLGLHYLLISIFGDNPSYLTVDDAGDQVDLKEAVAVLLAALVAYLIVCAMRPRLNRR
jgi:hypothetical protein